jgi:hypothetical protein
MFGKQLGVLRNIPVVEICNADIEHGIQQKRKIKQGKIKPEFFSANRLFVTIDPIDDIESLLKFGTEDNLMIGTDYSHTDISANLSALDEVRGWVEQGRISNAQAQKILENNSRAFYAF